MWYQNVTGMANGDVGESDVYSIQALRVGRRRVRAQKKYGTMALPLLVSQTAAHISELTQ
jgi:hypothetical protein